MFGKHARLGVGHVGKCIHSPLQVKVCSPPVCDRDLEIHKPLWWLLEKQDGTRKYMWG